MLTGIALAWVDIVVSPITLDRLDFRPVEVMCVTAE